VGKSDEFGTERKIVIPKPNSRLGYLDKAIGINRFVIHHCLRFSRTPRPLGGSPLSLDLEDSLSCRGKAAGVFSFPKENPIQLGVNIYQPFTRLYLWAGGDPVYREWGVGRGIKTPATRLAILFSSIDQRSIDKFVNDA